MPKIVEFTDAEQAKIVSLYMESGFTVADLARHMSCSAAPIHRVLRDHDVPMRPQGEPLKHDRNQKILDMNDAGHTVVEIAKALGITKQRVNQVLSRGY